MYIPETEGCKKIGTRLSYLPPESLARFSDGGVWGKGEIG